MNQKGRARQYLRLVVAIGLLVFLSGSTSGLRELPRLAVQKSQLTLPGSVPFHLTATVLNPKDPSDRAHTARIEELWVSPQKWRRKVTTPDFSQLLIVNGGRVHEEITGDYDPNWLRTLVNGLFDPGAPLQGIDLTASDDNPVRNTKQVCRRFATAVGIAPVSNDVFSTYCFLNGLLDGVNIPGYVVDYKDYAPFSGKQVSRRVQAYLGGGLYAEARIVELNVLKAPDESLFAITEAHPLLKTVFVSEQDARAHILDAAPMVWPKIHEGQAVGLASIYVCIDRDGRVRETHNLNNDHPDIADSAREQVMHWRFRQFMSEGVPVQAETILTWAYSTELE
ncbi:MAG TPA: hypothetical protein VF713_10935 [Thermoanaerobaculia bacterium]